MDAQCRVRTRRGGGVREPRNRMNGEYEERQRERRGRMGVQGVSLSVPGHLKFHNKELGAEETKARLKTKGRDH